MSTKAAGQITLIDLTDGYSVILTNENYTFLGDTDSVSGTQTTTCQIQALRGSEIVPCTVDNITCPSGLSIVSNGQSPSPTLTITATSALKTSGSVVIPVHIGDVTISKVFSWSIAFRGQDGQDGADGQDGQDGTSVTVTDNSVTYQVSSSGTTVPTGTWHDTPPTTSAGQYLWTRTIVEYSDGNSTTSYSVSRNGTNGQDGADGQDGQDGESISITNNSITYQASSSGTTVPTGNWQSNPPSTSAGQYLWTKTEVTYSDGTKTTSYSVSRNGTNGQDGQDGADGQDGQDALAMVITSSNGSIFKNTDIATTLTAHVYKGAAEVTGSALTALGTIKWYKDGGTTAVATGTTLTINPGDVTNNAVYTAQLEG